MIHKYVCIYFTRVCWDLPFTYTYKHIHTYTYVYTHTWIMFYKRLLVSISFLCMQYGEACFLYAIRWGLFYVCNTFDVCNTVRFVLCMQYGEVCFMYAIRWGLFLCMQYGEVYFYVCNTFYVCNMVRFLCSEVFMQYGEIFMFAIRWGLFSWTSLFAQLHNLFVRYGVVE